MLIECRSRANFMRKRFNDKHEGHAGPSSQRARNCVSLIGRISAVL